MRHRPFSTLLVAIAFTVGSACGATGGFADDQPSHKTARLEAGELAALPLPGGTAPFGAPSQRDGVVTQSFKVTALSPEDVLDFYAEALPAQGWAVATAPVARGTDVWRGEWARNGRLLQVTASPDVDDGTDAGDGSPTTQLNLQLRASPGR